MSRLLILSLLCQVQYFTKVTEQTSCGKSCGFAHTPAWNRTGSVNFRILYFGRAGLPSFSLSSSRLQSFSFSAQTDSHRSHLLLFSSSPSDFWVRPCLSPSRAPSHVHIPRLYPSVFMLSESYKCFTMLNRGAGSKNVRTGQ